jgi:hypothetical protein
MPPLGTMFGGTMVHYQNKNAQYLAPDSTATPLTIHWLVRRELTLTAHAISLKL